MAILRQLIYDFRQQLLIALALIILVVGVMNIYLATSVNTFSNDDCVWRVGKTQSGKWGVLFQNVKPGGVTSLAGIHNEDIFLTINDVSIKDPFEAQKILNKVKARDSVKYVYERNNQVYATYVKINKVVVPNNLNNGIVGLIWFIIGFIVIMSKPEGKEHQLFFFTGATTVLVLTRIALHPPDLSITPSSYFSPYYYYPWLFLSAFNPAMIFHFFLLFPEKSKLLEKKYTISTIYFSALVIFFICVYILNMDESMNVAIRMNLPEVILTVYTYISYVFGFVILVLALIRTKNKSKRLPISIIIVSYIITASALAFVSYMQVKWGKVYFFEPIYFYPIFLSSAIPVAFGIAIFKYHLIDSRRIFRNTVTYGTVTLTLGTLYLVIVYALGQSVGEAFGNEYKNLLAIVMFIIFYLIFQSIKDKSQSILVKRFFPEAHFRHQKLADFSKELANVVGLENILESLKVTFINEIKLGRFVVYLIDDNQRYEMKACKGDDCNYRTMISPKPLMDLYISEVYLPQNKRAIEQSDFFDAFPADAEWFYKNEIYTIIPLIVNSKMIGLIGFGLKLSGAKFEGKDLELLNSVASQTAISFENARLYKAEAEKTKFERELELARNIQQDLLPKQFPNSNGIEIYGKMIPAMQIGGDYFDVISAENGRTYVVIGDVSGKGLYAALYMAKLQSYLQMLCKSNRTPKEIMIDLNAALYGSLKRNQFITLTLAVIDSPAKTISFARAGHMPTIEFSNGKIKEYVNKGLALGLDSGKIFNSTIVEQTVETKSGQIFFFYSDGVNEMMNSKSHQFGMERIKNLIVDKHSLSPKEIFDFLWSKLLKFKGDTEQSDDVTAVIVKINE